ncbi:MAG: putative aldouronate transport system permease protein [Clostridiales bacterium]|nr:putative aldouronate transport system permease protein [Clostridiales bacterium]
MPESKNKSVKTLGQGNARLRRYRRFMPLYIMMIPSLLYLLINNYVPMAGLVIAFKKVNFQLGILKSPWVGFDNFKFLFSSPDAMIITRNTIFYNVCFLLIGPLVAITVSILLDELRWKMGKRVYQTIILMPYLISIVVVSYLVNAFLNSNSGFINNSILGPAGFDPISWYSEARFWPYILIFVNIWKGFGYSTIIYYSTVVSIDRELYEAASIDGASRWQQIKSVTLPGLKTTFITLTLLGIGRIFYSDFGLFFQVPMNSGALIDATNTIDTYVYRGLISSPNIGMTAAAGFYQSVVGFGLVLAANLLVGKLSKEDALF